MDKTIIICATALLGLAAFAQGRQGTGRRMRENPDAKLHRFSTTVEKERPQLNDETKRLIAAYHRNPTDENRAALRKQCAINYDNIVRRKKAKLEELKRTGPVRTPRAEGGASPSRARPHRGRMGGRGRRPRRPAPGTWRTTVNRTGDRASGRSTRSARRYNVERAFSQRWERMRSLTTGWTESDLQTCRRARLRREAPRGCWRGSRSPIRGFSIR